MSDYTLLGPWIRRFLLEHVVAERNLARNTQHRYRDAFGLLIPFVARMPKSLSIVSLWSISRCGSRPPISHQPRVLAELQDRYAQPTACRHPWLRRLCGGA
jgi:hypothetical protein